MSTAVRECMSRSSFASFVRSLTCGFTRSALLGRAPTVTACRRISPTQMEHSRPWQ